jgi:hypothetical protein
MELPLPGQIARLRQRLYLVEQIVLGARSGDTTLVRMSCVDDDNQGQPLEVLWERELDPEILTGEAWESIAQRGFDEPELFQAYLKTLTWNCVTATDPRMFQSPFRAGIRLDAYQLEPLRESSPVASGAAVVSCSASDNTVERYQRVTEQIRQLVPVRLLARARS